MNINFKNFTKEMLAALPKSPKKTRTISKRGRSSPNVDMEQEATRRRSTRPTTQANTALATRNAETAAIKTNKKRVMRALKNDDPNVITPTPTPKPKPKPTPSRPQSAQAPHGQFARGRVIKPSSTKDKILSKINVTPSTIRKNNHISSKNAIEKFKIQLKKDNLTEEELLALFTDFTKDHFEDYVNDIKQAILSRRRTNNMTKEIQNFEKENQTFISKKKKLNEIMLNFKFDTELNKVLKKVKFPAVKAALNDITNKISKANTNIQFMTSEVLYTAYVDKQTSLRDDFCEDVQTVFQDPTIISTDKLNQLEKIDPNIHIGYLHMLNVHANNKCNEFKERLIELNTKRESIYEQLKKEKMNKNTNMDM